MTRLGWTLVAAFSLIAASAQAETKEFTLDGKELLVTDLIGRITVSPGPSDKFIVRATADGRDAAKLSFDTSTPHEFDVAFPLKTNREYANPPFAKVHGNVIMDAQDWSNGRPGLLKTLSILAKRDRIRIGKSSGLEMWADLEVLVPKGSTLKIVDGLGSVTVAGIEATLSVETYSGNAKASDVAGDTRIETSDGDIDVASMRGALSLETGSGNVQLDSADGPLSIETGSGDVTANLVTSPLARIEVGSGKIRLHQVSIKNLDVDSGSGGVEASGVEADKFRIESGSGDVEATFLTLDRGAGSVETGSGSILLRVPANASASVHAESASGEIEIDHPAATKSSHRRDEDDDIHDVSLALGEGKAVLRLESGSGRIGIKTTN